MSFDINSMTARMTEIKLNIFILMGTLFGLKGDDCLSFTLFYGYVLVFENE